MFLTHSTNLNSQTPNEILRISKEMSKIIRVFMKMLSKPLDIFLNSAENNLNLTRKNCENTKLAYKSI